MPDRFAAEDHHGFDFREDQMTISEDGIPNQSLQATPVGAGLVVWSHGSGVPELGRSAHTPTFPQYGSARKKFHAEK